jgi:hypothetical protein
MELTISEALQSKWKPVLEHPELPEISDPYRRAVTTILLENQQQYLREDGPANISGNDGGLASPANMARWDPILISLVRRSMPNLMAYDVCGVQPMSGPTGLIFALRSRYNNQFGDEALFQEASTKFSGSPATGMTGASAGGTMGQFSSGGVTAFQTDPFAKSTWVSDSITGSAFSLGEADPFIGTAMATNTGEGLGYPNGSQQSGNQFAQMAFSIEKATVSAQTRALKAEYTMELAQDLKAIHGLDAETELANILSSEILAEINREVVRRIYVSAKLGARSGLTQTAGVFDLNVDSNGRWSVEKFKGLLFQIERECNAIAKETRRGKGNFIICSADVASALSMAGVLDYAPALSTNLNVDDTGNTFAGVLNGRLRVYIDPYASQTASHEFFCVGYKGSSPYDAGLFYCPYVPLQMVRAVGENSFQPKIGFKTRYGLIHNPFVLNSNGAVTSDIDATVRRNMYYRIVKVTNLF